MKIIIFWDVEPCTDWTKWPTSSGLRKGNCWVKILYDVGMEGQREIE
jgi:hypothetical protein